MKKALLTLGALVAIPLIAKAAPLPLFAESIELQSEVVVTTTQKKVKDSNNIFELKMATKQELISIVENERFSVEDYNTWLRYEDWADHVAGCDPVIDEWDEPCEYNGYQGEERNMEEAKQELLRILDRKPDGYILVEYNRNTLNHETFCTEDNAEPHQNFEFSDLGSGLVPNRNLSIIGSWARNFRGGRNGIFSHTSFEQVLMDARELEVKFRVNYDCVEENEIVNRI